MNASYLELSCSDECIEKKEKNNEQHKKTKTGLPEFFGISSLTVATVPVSQSEELYQKLIENGVEAEYNRLDGAKHATAEFAQEEVKELILEFMNR